MEDDVYKGYFIPAGTTVFENVWAVFYDEAVYPAPSTYDPERFLKDGKLDRSVSDPEDRIFGSGRRVCPGRHFALRTLFLNISCTLATLDIEPLEGQTLEGRFHENAIRYPLPFKCVIRPRSEARLQLIKEASIPMGS